MLFLGPEPPLVFNVVSFTILSSISSNATECKMLDVFALGDLRSYHLGEL